MNVAFTRVSVARDTSGQGLALERYQIDLSCAAAAEIRLIGLPAGTPVEEQNKALSRSALFASHAQTSGHEAGHSPMEIAGAIKAFTLWGLPRVKSSDPTTVAKVMAETEKAMRKCAALPSSENMFQEKGKASGRSTVAETVVPIRKVTLPTGGRFFSLPLRVGTHELTAGIDTGSAGLRVLSRALDDHDYQATGQSASLTFGSGTVISGIRATANVAFGSLSGPVDHGSDRSQPAPCQRPQ